MNIYSFSTEELQFFESLKHIAVDVSTLEPLITTGIKRYGIENGMYGRTHNQSSKTIMSNCKAGKTAFKDSLGNTFLTSIDDPRVISGELVGIAKDKILAKDSFGNNFLVDKDDPRFLSGELVGVNKGKTWKQKVPSPLKGTFLAKDKHGNMCRLTKEDPRYISKEFIHFRSKF